MVVTQHRSAHGYLGLNEHRFAQWAVSVFEMGGDVRTGFGMFFERQIQQLGDALAGEVVTGGTKTAGDDDELGTGDGFADGGLDGFTGVGYGLLMGECVPQKHELLGKPMVVGVEDAPNEEFTAGVDEFHAHVRSVPRRCITRNAKAFVNKTHREGIDLNASIP